MRTSHPIAMSLPKTSPAARGACALVLLSSLILPYADGPVPVAPLSLLALLGWGLVLSSTEPDACGRGRWGGAAVAVLGAALAMVVAAGATRQWMAVGGLVAATGVLSFGLTVSDGGRWTRLVFGVILLGGVANLIAGLAQVWIPGAAESFWFAASEIVAATGRAGGYLRQSNQLASLLLLALIGLSLLAAMATGVQGRWRLGASLLAGLLGVGVAVTASRSAILALAIITAWMWRDREWPIEVRRLPLWACAGLLVGFVLHPILGQVSESGQLSRTASGAMRWALWKDTLGIIREHPWSGVGWGQFSFVWALSPNAGRVPEAFGHTHNLALQLGVELGIPVALAVLGALAWALWFGRAALSHPDGERRMQARAAYLTWVVLLVHSVFEYPLWYPFFLLPAAYCLGLILRLAAETRSAPFVGGRSVVVSNALRAMGVVMVLGTLFAVWDYSRQIQVYSPFGAAGFQPLERRIQHARQSVLFGAFADFAALSVAPNPEQLFDAFDRPLHYGINGELLVAYSRAWHALGDEAKAVYVAQRAREFKGPVVDQFFQPCQESGGTEPFQCVAEPVGLSYRDFQ